ncbi:hypothetical protein [uncultured Adlercreutzia sp.]|uniref:hypothetical protein n=1 Tax=uncultured Adlercreutzia sp. TaxID=875803 RepID=UPI002589409A|nr:hypothetical protein [uncultured Adlercreutzia sp.]
MKSKTQIKLFLQEAKRIVRKNGFILVPRAATERFMAEWGIDVEAVEGIILALSPEDCFDGPEPDRDARYAQQWTVAEFAPEHPRGRLYLKISISMRVDRCKCLSVKLYSEESK